MNIIFFLISLFICFGLPIILAIYIVKKGKAHISSVIIGGVVFFIVQPVIRFSILSYLYNNIWFILNIKSSIIILSLFLGLTAGIFEEGGRFLAFKFMFKNKLNRHEGIAYGIGHGGCEAMVLVGTAMISSVMGHLSVLSPYELLEPGVERLCSISVHIALSIIVMYSVKSKKYWFLLVAILLHAALDSPLGIIKNTAIIQTYILIFGVISFVFIMYSTKIKLYYK